MNNQNDIQEIFSIAKNLRGKIENIDQMAADAVAEGLTVESFRSRALDRLPSVKPLEKPLLHDVAARDWKHYSITRAISNAVNGRNLDGFEREMNDEVSRRTGQNPTGMWIPQEALMSKRNFVAGTGTLGGMIVETSNLGEQFIELLRNKAQVVAMGARVINLNNPVTIPRQSGAGVANWVAETTAATLSTGDFEQITLTPKAITAYQQYSKQLLVTNNPSIDTLIRDDINQIIALAIDKAALGVGGGAVPVGILGTAGINTVSVALLASNALTTSLFPFLVSLETECATDNADLGALGYIMRSKERAACKTTQRFSGVDGTCWEPGDKVNGYKVGVSNQLAENLTTGTATTICSCIYFGNWNDLLIGQFAGGATDLVVDNFTLAVNGVTRLIARRWVDIGLRHPESMAVGGGILA